MKKLIIRLLHILTLGIVRAIPSGLVAEKDSQFGLFALMSNTNALQQVRSAVTTAGTDSTLTGAQAVAGALILAAGASNAFTITLPSTAALITALGPTIPTDGTFSKIVAIKNDGVGQTGTLTAGDASTTITGTATIATNTVREFLLTVNGPTTVTFENMGSASL